MPSADGEDLHINSNDNINNVTILKANIYIILTMCPASL